MDEEYEFEGYGQRRGRGSRREDEEYMMLEKAFREGCEHGYRKAMREMEGYNERGGMRGAMGGQKSSYREGFEETLERIKKKFE